MAPAYQPRARRSWVRRNASASARGVPPTAAVGCSARTTAAGVTPGRRRARTGVRRWETYPSASGSGAAPISTSEERGSSAARMLSTTAACSRASLRPPVSRSSSPGAALLARAWVSRRPASRVKSRSGLAPRSVVPSSARSSYPTAGPAMERIRSRTAGRASGASASISRARASTTFLRAPVSKAASASETSASQAVRSWGRRWGGRTGAPPSVEDRSTSRARASARRAAARSRAATSPPSPTRAKARSSAVWPSLPRSS